MSPSNPGFHSSLRGVSLALLCAMTVFIFGLPSLHGSPLNISGNILAPGQAGPTGGVVVAGPLSSPFIAPTFTGTLTSEVIAGDPSNGLGGLTFVYALSNNPLSPDAIERLTINSYSGFTIDASYQAPAIGQVPTLIDRSAAPGDVVGFSFINPIPAIPGFGQGVLAPGASSALLVLQTNAAFSHLTVASVIDGNVANASAYAPVIPEPSTLVLGTMGLVGVTVWRMRRSRKLVRQAAKA
jgi:hypothetical protein